jgi:DUF2934 family protein
MDRNWSDRIRERAYEIWLAADCRHGEAEQHWFAAERETLARSSLIPKAANAAAKVKRKPRNHKRSKESGG